MRIRRRARPAGSFQRLNSPQGVSLYGPVFDPIQHRKWENANHDENRARLVAESFSLYDDHKLKAAYVRLEIE